VKELIAVDLPLPRDQLATKELPEFARLRAHVYRLIKRERPAPSDLEAAEALAAAHPES
jgi:NitT/TauT family transport system ATP-binding protein